MLLRHRLLCFVSLTCDPMVTRMSESQYHACWHTPVSPTLVHGAWTCTAVKTVADRLKTSDSMHADGSRTETSGCKRR